MDLYSQITAIYHELAGMPWLFSDGTIELKNSGDGDYIAAWNYAQPKPTPEQLAAAVTPPAALIDALRAEICKLEREEMMPHGIRVFVIASFEKEAVEAGAARSPPLTATQSKTLLRAGNPGYRRVIEFHELISSKEAQIVALGGEV